MAACLSFGSALASGLQCIVGFDRLNSFLHHALINLRSLNASFHCSLCGASVQIAKQRPSYTYSLVSIVIPDAIRCLYNGNMFDLLAATQNMHKRILVSCKTALGVIGPHCPATQLTTSLQMLQQQSADMLPLLLLLLLLCPLASICAGGVHKHHVAGSFQRHQHLVRCGAADHTIRHGHHWKQLTAAARSDR